MSILSHIGQSIKNITPYQPGKSIATVMADKGISDILKLASNENQLGASPKALAAIKNSEASALSRYPDANGVALIEALSHQLNIPSNQIVLGNGSNEILELTAHLLLNKQTAAVYSDHAFIVYSLATLSRCATPIITKADNFAHDLTAMADACVSNNNVRVVFIANPNNPTGTYCDMPAIKRFMQQIPDDILVVLDEAYCEYLPLPHRHASLSLLQEFSNLLITRTFSKIYGLAGLRIGYGISHPDIIALFNRVRQPFNANALAQTAALHALDDSDHLTKSFQMNNNGLAFFQSAFRQKGIDFIPSHANFIAFKPRVAADVEFNRLLERGIITRQLTEYNMTDWLRVTIGTQAENAKVIDNLSAVNK